jgi:hypothetical protein
MIGKAIIMGAGAAKAGRKAKKAGGDARAVTKAAVRGAGIPGMDKAIDIGFDKGPGIIEAAKTQAPGLASRAGAMAQGIADKLTKPTTIAPQVDHRSNPDLEQQNRQTFF